jgi:hypothetical protein
MSYKKDKTILDDRTGYCNSCFTMSEYLNGARYAAGILMCNQCVDREFDAITSDPTIIGSEAWLMEGAR